MCKERVKNFGKFAEEIEDELKMTKDMTYIKSIFKEEHPDTIIEILRHQNTIFEAYVEVFSNFDQYEDILTDDLIYSNRINNILFQCSIPNEVFMVEIYDNNLMDENLKGYTYLNISETNFNNISTLQLNDAQKDDREGDIIGNVKFILDYSAIDFKIKKFWFKSISYFNDEYNGCIENDRMYTQLLKTKSKNCQESTVKFQEEFFQNAFHGNDNFFYLTFNLQDFINLGPVLSSLKKPSEIKNVALAIRKNQIEIQQSKFEIKQLSAAEIKNINSGSVFSSLHTRGKEIKNHVKTEDQKYVTYYFQASEDVFLSMSCLKSSLDFKFFCKSANSCFQFELAVDDDIIAHATIHACQFQISTNLEKLYIPIKLMHSHLDFQSSMHDQLHPYCSNQIFLMFDLKISWQEFQDKFEDRVYEKGIVWVGQMNRNLDYKIAPDTEAYYEIEMLLDKKQKINKVMDFQKDIHKRNIFTNLFSFPRKQNNKITCKIIKNLSNTFDETQKAIMTPEEMTTEIEVKNSSFFLNFNKNEEENQFMIDKDNQEIIATESIIPFSSLFKTYEIREDKIKPKINSNIQFNVNLYFQYFASDFIEMPQGNLTIKLDSDSLTRFFDEKIFDKSSELQFFISSRFESQQKEGTIEQFVKEPVVLETETRLQNVLFEAKTIDGKQETCVIKIMNIPLVSGEEVSHPFIIAKKNLSFKFIYMPHAEQKSQTETEKDWQKKLDEEVEKQNQMLEDLNSTMMSQSGGIRLSPRAQDKQDSIQRFLDKGLDIVDLTETKKAFADYTYVNNSLRSKMNQQYKLYEQKKLQINELKAFFKNDPLLLGKSRLSIKSIRSRRSRVSNISKISKLRSRASKRSQKSKKSKNGKSEKEELKSSLKDIMNKICECGQQQPKYRGYCIKCVQRIKDNYEKEMKKYTPMLEELKNVKKGIRDKQKS